MTDSKVQQSVRFGNTSHIETPSGTDTIHLTDAARRPSEQLTEQQRKELREMSVSIQQSKLQSSRMDQFIFDPVSLPPSRVPSHGSSTQQQQGSGAHTPITLPSTRDASHQVLTPAHSGHKTEQAHVKAVSDTLPVTPQDSPSTDTAGPTAKQTQGDSQAASSKELPLHTRPAQLQKEEQSTKSTSHDSFAATPAESTTSDVPDSRPYTPATDVDHPYSRAKRPTQIRDGDNVEPRFMFGGSAKEKEKSRSSIFACPSPRSPGIEQAKAEDKDKRSSIFGNSRRDSDEDTTKKHKLHHHHGSMSDLKRFFKIGKKDKHDKQEKQQDKQEKAEKREKQEKTIAKSSKSSGISTPSGRVSSMSAAAPFADDHGLEAKYGKFEKILGSGAGGSVRLMKRADGVTFAVKQFRERHSWETPKAYNKKITAEFCIGSTLHHGNIIEAMDIVSEKGRWYEVMEYAPYDLFAIVMTGKMSREEVACCFLQILNGLAYLHSMGLAHRDMKLDNVVVNDRGIMKIIDFGSAHVFQYPFEGGIVQADGVVGSDPYLAPEVFTQKTYDARAVDIWSLAIIFCCMSLRRFPWKCPKSSDNSFKLFTTQPTEEELAHPLYPQKAIPQSESASNGDSSHHHHHRHQGHSNGDSSAAAASSDVASENQSSAAPTVSSTSSAPPQNITLKGPWRLLRLLPRETRHIIGRMLEIDPTKRATLEEVLADPWVTKTPFCKQEVGGHVDSAEGHKHILVGGSSAS